MPEDLAQARRRYAEQVGALADVAYRPIVEAFAAVPRERFVGPGPWTLYSAGLAPQLTPNADPTRLYENVLVSLDAAKRLNNGEPRFWAWLFERLRPALGERVIHVGAGVGYYTAILAEMVGPDGQVTGIEFEPDLAARAQAALADRPNVEMLAGDAHSLAAGAADVIVASCGFDAVPLHWMRLLRDGGRMLIPLTAETRQGVIGGGAMLLVTRRGAVFDARFVGATFIYHDMSGRTPEASARLAAALPPFEAGKAWRAESAAPQRVPGALTTTPPLMTPSTCSRTRMSASGSPVTAIISP